MKINVSELVQNFAVLGGDLLASFMGAKLADRGKEKVASEVVKGVVQTILQERDDELLKDLLQLEKNGEEILKILEEANHQGFVKVGGKIYREGLIERLLRSIEPKDRSTVFRNLNEACARSREEFFGLLGVLHNDNWVQVMRVTSKLASEELDKLQPHFRRIRRKLRPTADRLSAEAKRKGWRSWLDF